MTLSPSADDSLSIFLSVIIMIFVRVMGLKSEPLIEKGSAPSRAVVQGIKQHNE
jgi:hypothetical protein